MTKLAEQHFYGSTSSWKWIGIYLIVGVALYGALYFSLFDKKGSYINLGSIDQNTAQYSYSK